MLMQDNKESFNMEKGDVIRVPSGAMVYFVNNNNDQTLRVAKLKQPVNTPGLYEVINNIGKRFRPLKKLILFKVNSFITLLHLLQEFFPASSQNADSYINVFSNDILESAFNVSFSILNLHLLGTDLVT